MAELYFGTCSWKYESWRGILYPEFGELNYLEEYSKQYKSVEIDQWFWSLHNGKALLPKNSVVKDYVESVPDDFKFTIKVPNSITLTHPYKKNEPNVFFLSNDLMEAFIDSLSEMKEKIGMLMFQFEYLNKQKMSSLNKFINQLDEFFSHLKTDISYGIEIRNSNYLKPEFFEFLNSKTLHMVFLQGYYMPNIFEVYENFGKFINDKVVIRLHGFDRKGIEEKTNGIWDSIVEPKDDEIEIISRMVKTLLKNNVDVFMNVNNHYEGSAPLTIRKLQSFITN